MSRRFDVIGLGLACADRLCVVKGMPTLEHGAPLLDYREQGGGPAATAAVAAARLGARVGMVCKVGDDKPGKEILEELASYGIDTSHAIIQKGAKSFVCIVLVRKETGERSFIFGGATLEPIRLDELDRDYITSGRALHTDMVAEPSLQAMQWAREAGMIVSVDCGLPAKGAAWPTLVDVLISPGSHLSAEEALARLAEIEGPSVKIATLGDRGAVGLYVQSPETRLETPGARGAGREPGVRDPSSELDNRDCSSLVPRASSREAAPSGTRQFRIPAYKVPVVDTTGCGDVYHGAFVVAMLQGWDVERCARFASIAAALKATKLGGRSGIPTFEEVMARMGQ